MTDTITPFRLATIKHTKGHLQLIACAGAGKTGVVARHATHLLKSGKKPDPKSIIPFTFSDKAAVELKERKIQRCREEPGNTEVLAEMYVGMTPGSETAGRCHTPLASGAIKRYGKDDQVCIHRI